MGNFIFMSKNTGKTENTGKMQGILSLSECGNRDDVLDQKKIYRHLIRFEEVIRFTATFFESYALFY